MPEGLQTLLLDPAFVLSLLVGAFHTCMYLVIRGRLGWHILAVFAAATMGAIAGQALGSRVGDLLTLGDYSLLWASVLAWMGIAIVVATSSITSRHEDATTDGGEVRPRQREP